VAIYELDEESILKILDIPDVQLPNKGKKHEGNRIKAVMRKYKEMNPSGPGEVQTNN
jgi:hypothetical protein